MKGILAVLLIIGATASAARENDSCSLSYLYDLVKSDTLKVIGLPETAVFPDLEDVKIEQTGFSCIFTMTFKFTAKNLSGEATTIGVKAQANRLFNAGTGDLAPPHVSVEYVSQE